MRAHATPWVEAGSLLEIDDKSNPQKFNGMGEPGICGSGAAVANAVYNARAARGRNYRSFTR